MFVLYAWHLSYFSGKVRSYLRYKGIPFVERPVSLFAFRFRIPRKTGVSAMPVVVTPEGAWIQDSSVIIDDLEKRYPERPIVPESPVLRFAAYVAELWADEAWIPAAMHTRWSFPANYPLFEREAGSHLLPGLPRALQRIAARTAANEMRKHLPAVGVVPAQYEVLERWTRRMLSALELHFTYHPYLFGDRPTLGDFPRSPGADVRAPWARSVAEGGAFRREAGSPARLDRSAWREPPASRLEPVPRRRRGPGLAPPGLSALLAELVPMLEKTLVELRAFRQRHPEQRRVPRGLGVIEVPLREGGFRRAALPYGLWMAQRLLEVFRAMAPRDQDLVRAWLRPLGGEPLLSLDVPPLRRDGLSVAFVGRD